ncbi:DUF3862 domain-containing protein [Lactobacillus sp. LC28-10]|uniref:DUF3862 domain-containing protein n=1 Tax=Secundilactobacillus angelensis TaxID=2722706 RepID=A0ABX1L244_9LACO|nr:DUF3862 domain-containing protein [Secundilactobacillus angelensis]MCH5463182.1 DUF3862 domain-containing protein [Secundilactobacillus angelensis]NLR19525.1 DUF3862 domain-containing protein [Secundilactobacillus angelensis]
MKKLFTVIMMLLTGMTLSACSFEAFQAAKSNASSEAVSAHNVRSTRINHTMKMKFDQIKTDGDSTDNHGSSKAQVMAVMGKPDRESKSTRQGSDQGSKVYTWTFSRKNGHQSAKTISIDVVHGRAVSKNIFHNGIASKIHPNTYQHIKKGDQLATVRKKLGTPTQEMIMGNKGPYSSQILVYLDQENEKTYTFSFVDQKLISKSSSNPKHGSTQTQSMPCNN